MSKVKFKIIDGGKAIPIGNNLYKLIGRSHEEGGIGIELKDGNAKTIIEAEDGEDFEPKTHEFRIFSNSLKIGNKTPAQLAEAGYNPDIIFKAQQSINGNYGGSYAKDGSEREIIGGTPNESRIKYYKKDKQLTETINAIANEYGIDNELLLHRIAKEGLIDQLINYNNYGILRNDKNISSGIDYNNIEPFSLLGLDDSYDNYEKYKLNRNIPVIRTPSINEKGREVNSIITRNITDAIELMAADLNYRKERLASNGVKPTNSLISASYNRGIKGAIDMYKNNPDSIDIEYGIPDIYSDIVDKNTNNKIKGADNVIFNNTIDYILNTSGNNYLEFGDIPFNDNQGIKNTFDKNIKSNFKGFTDEEINALEKEFYKIIHGKRKYAKKSEEEDIKDRSNFIVENDRTYIPIIDGNYKLKNGGQINFNEDNVKNWINSWLNSRKNQLKENAKSTSFAYRSYKSLNNKGDIRDNGYDVTYKDNLLNPLYFLLGENPNDIRTENIIKSQLYNIDNVATINVGNYYKPNYGKLGVYVNPNPWNNTGHYIAYKGVPLDGVRVHELTHASHPDQQIDYITDVIYKDRDIPVNKSGRQTNRDKAKEVYSAIQQYRFENGLKPEDVIDKTYIENNKDKIKSTPYLENINEDDLINIFNNVAKNDNKNKNNNVFYAKNGGQINMKLKHKNKQDITDIVMNEILPHSTGERKKFFTGGFWANIGTNTLNSLLQGIVTPILNYKMADEIEKSGKDLQPAQMSKTYLDSRDHTLNTLLGDVDRTVNEFIDISSKNTNNAKTHMNRVRELLSDATVKKQGIVGRSLNRSDEIRRENARMAQEVDKINITNKNQFALVNEQNRLDRQAAAMRGRMAGDKAALDSTANLLHGIGTAFSDWDKFGLSLLNSENPNAWNLFNKHFGKSWKINK